MFFSFEEIIRFAKEGNWSAIKGQHVDCFRAILTPHGNIVLTPAGQLAYENRLDLALQLVQNYNASPLQLFKGLLFAGKRDLALLLAQTHKVCEQEVISAEAHLYESTRNITDFKLQRNLSSAIVGAARGNKRELLKTLLDIAQDDQAKRDAIRGAAEGGHPSLVDSLRVHYHIDADYTAEVCAAACYGHADYVSDLTAKHNLNDEAHVIVAVLHGQVSRMESLIVKNRANLSEILKMLVINHCYDFIEKLISNNKLDITLVVRAAMQLGKSEFLDKITTFRISRLNKTRILMDAAKHGSSLVIRKLFNKNLCTANILAEIAANHGQASLVARLIYEYRASAQHALEGLVVSTNLINRQGSEVLVQVNAMIATLLSVCSTPEELKQADEVFQRKRQIQIPAEIQARTIQVIAWVEAKVLPENSNSIQGFWLSLMRQCIPAGHTDMMILETAITKKMYHLQDEWELRSKRYTRLAKLKKFLGLSKTNYMNVPAFFKQQLRPFLLTLYLVMQRLDARNELSGSLPPLPQELILQILDFCFTHYPMNDEWRALGGGIRNYDLPSMLQ